MSKHFDYFVIGGGSGGVRSARIAGSLGAKVGLAEGKDLGGTCVNVGCVPKKLMAYAADYHAHFEDSEGYGWTPGKATFNWKTLIGNKDKEISRLNSIYENMLEKNNVTIFKDYARFTGNGSVEVGDEKITADKFLIATGAKPRMTNFPGVEHTITSDDVFYLKTRPDHIVIIGGGYVAVEFAHIFRGLGSRVTLLYRGELFLRGFDDDLRRTLADEMEKQGIKLCFNCDIDSVEKAGNRKLEAKTENGEIITCDQVLMAIGRVANIEGLNLKQAGVKMEDGLIKIDKTYKTTAEDIYAVGDVANSWNLTPVATAEGQALARSLFGPEADRSVLYENIPTAVFTRPEIATTGLSEKAAREAGHDVETYKSRFRPMKTTLSGRDEYSLMKLVVDKANQRVIGCHIIGTDAAEMIQGFAVAMNCGATKADFDKTIGIHPTSAEELVTMK